MEYTRLDCPGHGGKARAASCPLRAQKTAEREPRASWAHISLWLLSLRVRKSVRFAYAPARHAACPRIRIVSTLTVTEAGEVRRSGLIYCYSQCRRRQWSRVSPGGYVSIREWTGAAPKTDSASGSVIVVQSLLFKSSCQSADLWLPNKASPNAINRHKQRRFRLCLIIVVPIRNDMQDEC